MDRNHPPPPFPNIYLIGLMGAGKTSIGQALARELGRTFLDSDQEIVTRTGVSISTIFEIEGEAGFRCRETRIITELTQHTDIVLATGGGVILAESNRECLRRTGWVIYLRQPPEILVTRTLKSRHQRPILNTGDPQASLRELFAERDPLYSSTAHLVLDAPRQGIRAICRYLL